MVAQGEVLVFPTGCCFCFDNRGRVYLFLWQKLECVKPQIVEIKYLKHKKTSNIEGKGILHIDHNGIYFKGKRNGKNFEFNLTLNETPTYGMCTDPSRFYTFVKGEFIEFYPHQNSVIKWFLVTEELHRLHGGKWQNYK